MSKRFKNVVRGAEEAEALQNYIKYLSDPTSRETKRQKGGSRDTTRVRHETTGYIVPFSVANTNYLLHYSETAAEAFQGFTSVIIGSRLKTASVDTTPAPVSPPRGFRPARATVFVPNGGATYAQSKITKLYYLKYEGKSHSLPFGSTSASEEFEVGGEAVKTGLKTAGANQQYFRVSVTPEYEPVA